MSEYTDEFPGIEVVSDPEPKPPEFVYVHLDEYQEVDITAPDVKKLNIYLFESEEDRVDELNAALDGLKKEYIYATGIVWPDWIEAEIDSLDTEMLDALKWMMVLGEPPEPEDMEIIEDFL